MPRPSAACPASSASFPAIAAAAGNSSPSVCFSLSISLYTWVYIYIYMLNFTGDKSCWVETTVFAGRKRQENNETCGATTWPNSSQGDQGSSINGNGKERKNTSNLHPRISDDHVPPRSPTLPAEIRRVNSPDNFRTPPPALVARLMGMEDAPVESAVAEKRRKQLLGALEKCDEDLKALKKIIDTVRSAERLRSAGGGKWPEQPSPVAVLLEEEEYYSTTTGHVSSSSSSSPLRSSYFIPSPKTFNHGTYLRLNCLVF